MSDNQTVKPNALVVIVNDSPLSIPNALEKIASQSNMPKPIQIGTALNFVYLSIDNFSRSPIESNHPEGVKIGSEKFYKYPITFIPVAIKRKTCFLIGCRFSSGLKQFITKHLENELQKLGDDPNYLSVDLLDLKSAMENGDRLKGNLKAIASRIDSFGDNGLEKTVLRGEDVFLSKKYNAIWDVLSGGVTNSLALHSIVLQVDINHRDIKISLDKFGNFRAAIDENGSENSKFSEIIKFLSKYSREKEICPLRRIKDKDADAENGDEQ